MQGDILKPAVEYTIKRVGGTGEMSSIHCIQLKGNVSPLRATFFTGNKNMYLHSMSFLHIDVTQVIEILP